MPQLNVQIMPYNIKVSFDIDPNLTVRELLQFLQSEIHELKEE